MLDKTTIRREVIPIIDGRDKHMDYMEYSLSMQQWEWKARKRSPHKQVMYPEGTQQTVEMCDDTVCQAALRAFILQCKKSKANFTPIAIMIANYGFMLIASAD